MCCFSVFSFVLLVITVFFSKNFDFPALGSDLTPGGLARIVFLYLVLCCW